MHDDPLGYFLTGLPTAPGYPATVVVGSNIGMAGSFLLLCLSLKLVRR